MSIRAATTPASDIRAREYEDPSLVAIGDGWSPAILGAWRRADAVVTECGYLGGEVRLGNCAAKARSPSLLDRRAELPNVRSSA